MNESYNQKVELTAEENNKNRVKKNIKAVLLAQNLANQRRLIKAISAELKVSFIDCAAALLFINEQAEPENNWVNEEKINPAITQVKISQTTIKLIRYRLSLGQQHNLDVHELKKVLVEESGVDVKNIANVRIQDTYTLIDLPDEMPQEIFHHLKFVEINGQQLDIKRVKPRNKKRGFKRHRSQHVNTGISEQSMNQ